MTKQISTKTPIRLYPAVRGPFLKHYKQMIDEHGASYAVNFALFEHLREKGHKLAEPAPPKERIAQGQRDRWRATKKVEREAEKKAQARREKKAEQEKARRAKKKAAAAETA